MDLKLRRRLDIVQYDTASREQLAQMARDYDAFVTERRREMPPALWRYFGYDTFHDGDITHVKFDAACRQLYLHVDCPNVKFSASPTSDFVFETVSFVVHFEDIHTFALERSEQETSSIVRLPTFRYAEIETAEEEVRLATERTGDRHHSIIIDADDLRLGCVCRDVHVEGAEPMAMTLMLGDPRFTFPFRV